MHEEKEELLLLENNVVPVVDKNVEEKQENKVIEKCLKCVNGKIKRKQSFRTYHHTKGIKEVYIDCPYCGS